MNPKAKYDGAIEFIETVICEGVSTKAGEIADRVVREKGQGISSRDMSAIIGFMTGDMLIPYVKSRQLVYAYKTLVEDGDANAAIAYTGLGDQPTFIKAFRRQFDMTPLEAIKKKDSSLVTPPKTWSVISDSNENIGIYQDEEDDKSVEEDLKFGIASSKLDLIKEALDLQAVYGFDNDKSEAAFNVAEKYSISMRKAFEFVDDFYMHFESYDNTPTAKDVEKSDALIYTYLTFDMMSVNQSAELILELSFHGVNDITLESKELVKAYLNYSEFSYSDLKEYYQYYINEDVASGGITLDEFIVRINLGFDLEGAADPDPYVVTAGDLAEEPVISIWAEEEEESRYSNNAISEIYDRHRDHLYYSGDDDDRIIHDEDRNEFRDYIDSLSDDGD